MARSCFCSKLLARAAADGAFRVLPETARLLWFEILAMASAAQVPGRLRFLHSVQDSVARLVSRSGTEVGTDLADLAAIEMIELDPDGVTLWLPGARAGQARAEAARRNGLRGGARRKGETLEAMRERRERERAASEDGTEGTEQRTQAAKLTRGRDFTSPSSKIDSGSSEVQSGGESAERGAPPWVTLGIELAELAGMDDVRGGYDYRPVQAWLDAGHSPDIIRAAVQRVVDSPGYGERRIFTLKYFDKAVMEEAARASYGGTAARQSTEERARMQAEQREIDRYYEARERGEEVTPPQCLLDRQEAHRAEIERRALREAETERWIQAVREGRDVPIPAHVAAAHARSKAQQQAA